MKILQLSDPHLVASDAGLVRGCPALRHWKRALEQATLHQPDCVLITGDLCQDESWGGYRRLEVELGRQLSCPVGVLPGNHDHPFLLNCVLGRHCTTAPGEMLVDGVRILLLNSHCSGRSAGHLGKRQLDWLRERLNDSRIGAMPLVIALHHPPLLIGHPLLDTMNLVDNGLFRDLLINCRPLIGILFGHVHQHWQGFWPERPDVQLLGCPSTLIGFEHVQPCPINRAGDPGGRLIQVDRSGALTHALLRWPAVRLELEKVFFPS